MKKKELLITLAGAAVLAGSAFALTGCSGSSGNTATMEEIASSFYVMDDNSGCLSCFGCVNMSSPSDCTGTSKYSYSGCVDCFGITTSDDTSADDINTMTYICSGYYCVNAGVERDGEITPVWQFQGYAYFYGAFALSIFALSAKWYGMLPGNINKWCIYIPMIMSGLGALNELFTAIDKEES